MSQYQKSICLISQSSIIKDSGGYRKLGERDALLVDKRLTTKESNSVLLSI